MANIPDVAEKWSRSVNKVVVGATAEEGGTRANTVELGGAGARCLELEMADQITGAVVRILKEESGGKGLFLSLPPWGVRIATLILR